MRSLFAAGRELRPSEKALFAFLVLLALTVLWVCLALSLPFAPYRSYGYSVAPSEACAGDLVRVKADRAIREPVLGSVERILVESEWREMGTATVFPIGDAEVPSLVSTRRSVTSPVIRMAPPLEGEWRLHSRFEVEGSVLGIDREQRFERGSAKTLTVTTKGCRRWTNTN